MNHNINATTLFNSIDYKNPLLMFNRSVGFFVHLKPVDSFLRGGVQ